MESRAEHVWVTSIGVWKDVPAAGLLLAWRLRPGRGWEGWVIVAEPGIGAQGDGPYVRQLWLPATAIKPATGPRP